MKIRAGKEADLEAVQYLIKQLAIYEKEPNEVSSTVNDLVESGFGPNKIFDFLVAETSEGIKGFALFFLEIFHLERKGNLSRGFLC